MKVADNAYMTNEGEGRIIKRGKLGRPAVLRLPLALCFASHRRFIASVKRQCIEDSCYCRRRCHHHNCVIKEAGRQMFYPEFKDGGPFDES